MRKFDKHRRPLPTGEAQQRITVIRRVEFNICGQQLKWWEADGQRFTGRACHMKALRAARIAASWEDL